MERVRGCNGVRGALPADPPNKSLSTIPVFRFHEQGAGHRLRSG
ncbi:hypothetical protein TRIP_B220041 [uncultured Desulfatiglans sp.]|uniref:Uncharacterized protein n=1 Tax=Uncultured Desulfatiglans sp. TaxID=1748965 RepID=A0A653A461_UNCDX|nr:hypothetical protein TRIP_B220041 [uncultured Desulfatiglans sp.]